MTPSRPRREPQALETTDATPTKTDASTRIDRLERAVAQLAIPGHIDPHAPVGRWIPDQLRGAGKEDVAALVDEYGQR